MTEGTGHCMNNTASCGVEGGRTPLQQASELQAQLERLLAGLSEHGARHLAEAETDLSQTGALLQEAITMLSGAFLELHAAVTAQQDQLARLLAQEHVHGGNRIRLQQLSEAVGTHVNTAVTCLQFQDLTSQLIGRATRRMAGLRGILSEASKAAEGLRDGESAKRKLEDAVASLLAQSTAMDQVLPKSVKQKHMHSGDIELF